MSGRAGGLDLRALLRSSGVMLVGQLVRAGAFAVTLVAVSRTLGAQGFGTFAAAVALVAVAVPFGGLGGGPLLVKAVARDPSRLAPMWYAALRMALRSGVLLTLAVLAAALLLFRDTLPLPVVACVALADLLLGTLFFTCWWGFVAAGRYADATRLETMTAIFRVIAAVILWCAAGAATVFGWALLYLGATAIATASAFLAVHRDLLRLGAAPPGTTRFDLREGFYFSASVATHNVYNDIDKSMLARLASASQAGIYAAAYRVIEVAYLPLRALFQVTFRDFFASGEHGVGETLRFARRFAVLAGAYAFAAGLAVWLLAPVVPLLLGASFADTADAVRWLAPILVLRLAHHLLGDALTGAGHQGGRTAVQAAVAGINIGLNLWLIPAHGWLGAAWASLATDALLALLVAALVRHHLTREAMPRESIHAMGT